MFPQSVKKKGDNIKIYLITDSNKFYGQKLFPWESIDVDYIINYLEEHYEVVHISFEELVNSDIEIKNSIVIYSSSQQPEYKEYIEDALLFLMQKGNHLIPSINVFKSHDNKGYQELHKKLLNIQSLSARYYGSYKEMGETQKFPSVIKYTQGFGSSGVNIVKNKFEIIKLTTKCECLISTNYLRTIRSAIAKPFKKYLFGTIYKQEAVDYMRYFKRFVLQEYIQGLTHDFKAIVFYDKIYVLKRLVKKNDFRASGSGSFIFEKASDSLLRYIEDMYDKFDEPFMAFDICSDGSEYYLIEFQGTHFGPYTLIHSEGYHTKIDNKWEFVNKKSTLKEEISRSLFHYIKRKYDEE